MKQMAITPQFAQKLENIAGRLTFSGTYCFNAEFIRGIGCLILVAVTFNKTYIICHLLRQKPVEWHICYIFYYMLFLPFVHFLLNSSFIKDCAFQIFQQLIRQAFFFFFNNSHLLENFQLFFTPYEGCLAVAVRQYFEGGGTF